MNWFSLLIIGLAYTLVVFWAGLRYGNGLEEDARKELQSLRSRLATKIRG